MATKIILKKSSVSGNAPTTSDIDVGEVALNLADKKLYSRDGNNNIIEIGPTDYQTLPVKADVAITKGTPLYATGAVGNSGVITVNKFIANNTIDELYLIGVAEKDFALGDIGKAVSFGEIKGINTTGSTVSETWTDGSVLYASSSTAGALTNVAPTAPNLTIPVAMVISAHATNGILFIRPSNGFHLGELHDVAISSIASGELLKWDGTKWVNNTLAEANIADLSHTHDDRYYTETEADSRFVNVTGDTMTGALNFGDNVKANFGAGSDLQLYHSGIISYIDEVGSGSLYIRSNGPGIYLGSTLGQGYADFDNGGAVVLRYAGNTKFSTATDGVSVTGNITVSGTVDGRDIAADGAKLDGIEAGADVTDTANVTAAGALMDSELANIAAVKALNQGVSTTDSPTFSAPTVSQLRFSDGVGGLSFFQNSISFNGASNGFNVFQGIVADRFFVISDSSGSTNAFEVDTFLGDVTVAGTVNGRDIAADGTKLDGIEAGADVTDFTNVQAAGAVMDSELTSEASVKALNQGVATTDSPTFAGGTFNGDVGVTGTVTLDDTLRIDGSSPQIIIAESDIPNNHRILASGGHLYIQARDSDNTNDGRLYLTGYNATDAELVEVRATTFNVNNNATVGGTLSATTVDLGNWTITETVGGELMFATGGVNKMKLDASGNLSVVGNVNSNATL